MNPPATYLFFDFRWVGNIKGRFPCPHVPHDAPLVHPIHRHGWEAGAKVSWILWCHVIYFFTPYWEWNQMFLCFCHWITVFKIVVWLCKSLQIPPKTLHLDSCGPDLKRRAALLSAEQKYATSWSNWDTFMLFFLLFLSVLLPPLHFANCYCHDWPYTWTTSKHGVQQLKVEEEPPLALALHPESYCSTYPSGFWMTRSDYYLITPHCRISMFTLTCPVFLRVPSVCQVNFVRFYINQQ